MKKKHPIKRFLLLLFLVVLVAALAVMPMLTANQETQEETASILNDTAALRDITRFLSYGAPIEAEEAEAVTVPYGVNVTEFLVANGDSVSQGDSIARVDSVTLMAAVQQVQESLETIAAELKEVRASITPGVISVDETGTLCSDGKPIDESKRSDYLRFVTLSEQHREYEELMLDLFRLCQDDTVTAPCAGLVSDVDKTQLVELSANGTPRLVFLATNTPTGEDDDQDYYCYVGRIELVDNGSWLLRRGADVTVTDFLNLENVDMTLTDETNIFDPAGYAIFRHGEEGWYTTAAQAGNIVLIVSNAPWIVVIGASEPEVPEDPTNPSEPEPTVPSTAPTGPSQDNPNRIPSGSLGGLGGLGSMGGFGGSGGMSFGGSGGNTDTGSSLCSTEKIQLATVTPMETMTITLSVDEADISLLRVGMTAEVTFEALAGQKYSAEITEISRFGITGDGSSKFEVTLQLPCSDGMLPGMNARVTIPLETQSDCLAIPVAALMEQGSKTVVYTGYDEKNKTLTEPVPVETGLSDGGYVQILSGLTQGQTIWYSYYDTLEISNAVERAGLFG